MFSPENIKSSVQEGNTSDFVEFIEQSIKKHPRTKLCPTHERCDFLDTLPQILDIFVTVTMIKHSEGENSTSRTVLLQACLKFLKLSCAHGKVLQGMIVRKKGAFEAMKFILNFPEEGILKKWTWHVLVNVIVDNSDTLSFLWLDFGEFLLTKMTENHENSAVTAAVLYNCLRIAMEENIQDIPTATIFSQMIGALERNIGIAETHMEFVHLSFEYLLSDSGKFKEIYSHLNDHDRLWTIFYITDHVKDNRQPQIDEGVLKYLPDQFNKKSECILSSNPQYEEYDPKEVMALLRSFAAITGSETYGKVYRDETTLFINTSALLVAVHKLSSQENSPFKPLGKLEDFSSKSQEAQEAEKDIFFELKTLLVRLIANLSHKNRKNQDIARELNVVLTICGCTTMDARNPMMKEWAIVALKNLLEANAENQNIIKSMVNTGPAANTVLSELTMENGTVRINRNQEQ